MHDVKCDFTPDAVYAGLRAAGMVRTTQNGTACAVPL
ncbi:hypothetical protein FHR65_003453 [Xanthomonas arboricola]|uniref:Uncharacterized protein n=1 Tax=Xanthomonas arboricola TaxID=56448 RepID=A0AB73H2H1_9XANT|nr:hypothetical protein [Xanthomonas arboricola]